MKINMDELLDSMLEGMYALRIYRLLNYIWIR